MKSAVLGSSRFAQVPSDSQFRVALQGDKAVGVPEDPLIVLGLQATLFLADESPNLVKLKVVNGDGTDPLPSQSLATFTDSAKQAENRCVVDAGDSLGRSNGVSFDQQVNHHAGLLSREVHAAHRWAVLREGFTAGGATVASGAVAVATMLAAIGRAVVARHFGLAFPGRLRQNERGYSTRSLASALGFRPTGSLRYSWGNMSQVAPAGFGPASSRSVNRRLLQLDHGATNSSASFPFPPVRPCSGRTHRRLPLVQSGSLRGRDLYTPLFRQAFQSCMDRGHGVGILREIDRGCQSKLISHLKGRHSLVDSGQCTLAGIREPSRYRFESRPDLRECSRDRRWRFLTQCRQGVNRLPESDDSRFQLALFLEGGFKIAAGL